MTSITICKEWEHEGKAFTIKHIDIILMDWHCGYVKFPTSPVMEDGYEGLLTYVPVHGGITYAEREATGATYGFDCNHYNSHDFPVDDLDWLIAQCELMARGIEVAAEYEGAYNKAVREEDQEEIAKVITQFEQALGVAIDISDNFGAMINVVFGEL